MSIISYLTKKVNNIQASPTGTYLMLANFLIVVFAIWFSNIGLLPFAKVSDFAIFLILTFLFALYRPGWAFLFFVGLIAFENINIAPNVFGLSLRPYQFFGFIAFAAFLVLFFKKRIKFDLPAWSWADWAVLVFSFSSLVSALLSQHKGVAMKQFAIAGSFAVLYFLTRIYVQNFSDAKKILPIFLNSSFVVAFYSIWQNFRFSKGINSFETMPGRPNATFFEPDWLGAYLVFLMAIVLSVIFYQIKKTDSFNFKNLSLIGAYGMLVLIFVALTITVARSAWLGAGIVLIGFVKLVAFNGHWNFGNPPAGEAGWNWKQALNSLFGIALALIFAIGIIKIFNLTSFELGGRAQSATTGLQQITISCGNAGLEIPKKIDNVGVLEEYNCRHINLEEIEFEKSEGRQVSTVYRPDPNFGIRAKIYQKSLDEIGKSPIFGIGWGNIGEILGKDENGNYLNSSNIFLEVWLGSGVIGLFSLMFVFGYIFFKAVKSFVFKHEKESSMVFVLLGFFAVLIPNLFNAGIFLGFLWVYLGIAVSLVNKR